MFLKTLVLTLSFLTSIRFNHVNLPVSIKSFNKSFGSILIKFNSLDTEVLYSLFNTYCVSFYGMEMWNRFYSTKYYRKISVSYHGSLKKISKVYLDFTVIILFVLFLMLLHLKIYLILDN